MQKQSLALAILGAMSVYGTVVLAGDVTIYGVADVGLNYSHVKTGLANAKDKVAMKSGQESGSRLGIRGSEDLSPDVEPDSYSRRALILTTVASVKMIDSSVVKPIFLF